MSNCPARAGFTSATNGCAVRTRDHPRSRGVYLTMMWMWSPPFGSSPLARGLPLSCVLKDPVERIIPARAGFTTTWSAADVVASDHPRSRGVYQPRRGLASSGRGSSPLARGLRTRRSRTGPQCRDHPRSRGVYSATTSARASTPRIIPARAGFTLRSVTVSPRTADHPRSRGVYHRGRAVHVRVAGSSPLARGLLCFFCVEQGLQGIIPARAGFTRNTTSCHRPSRDHPRSRGVYVSP